MEKNNIISIDNYEITETIHKSTEGVIYRAVEQKTRNKVLIKEYYPELVWSDDVLNEFFNLVSYLRFIEHEYILSVGDIGKYKSRPYIVFTDNITTLLCDRQAGQLDQIETINFMFRVAEALDFIHKQEILHGGLNPENIAIDPNGYPLLFDFGLSGVFRKLLRENMNDGFENLSISDLKYTAPEQIMGRNPTRASDIYVFGIVAYYYIFGEFPFDGQHTAEIALSHFDSNLIPVRPPESISLNTFQFIQKCLQVDPEKRFESFSQILGALKRMQSGKKARLRFEKRFAIKTKPVLSRIPTRLSLSFAVVVLGVSLFVTYYLSADKPEAAPPSTTFTVTIPAKAKPTQTQIVEAEMPVATSIAAPKATEQVQAGYKLAFEGETPYSPSEIISTSNLANLQEISRLGYGKPEEADVAPDNVHAAIATSAGVLIFEENQLLKWIDPQGWATSVQFSADGKTLAIGLMTGEIQLWDWENGVQNAPLTGEWYHTGKINRLLFSQGPYLYSASADRHIIVWDWKSGRSVRDIPAHSLPVNDIFVTSDGKTLVSCSDDQLIRVWDLASSRKLYELGSDYFDGAIKAVAISSDDAYLSAGGESGYLYQWKFITSSLSPGDKLPPRADRIPVAERIWSLEYIRNDQEILVGVDHGENLIYDATRVKYGGTSLKFEIPSRPKDWYDAFRSDFDFASFSVFRGDSIISVNWDGNIRFQQDQIFSPMFDNLDRLDFSSDGTLLAAGGKFDSTHVWVLKTNQTLFQNFYEMPFGDPISPDDSTIAIIVPSNDLRLGDIYQLKKLTGAQTTVDLSIALPNGNVGYAKNGSMFIAADLTTSKAWDFTSGIEVDVQAQDHFGCRITVPQSNIREQLLVKSANGIFLPGDDAHVDSLCPKAFQVKNGISAFSRDLNLLAFINSNGLLEAYNVVTKSASWSPYRLSSSDAVTSMAVSPDAAIIAVGNASGQIIFIDAKTGQPIDEIVGNFGKLQAIEFSEDGTMIATTGSDGVVRVFGIVDLK